MSKKLVFNTVVFLAFALVTLPILGIVYNESAQLLGFRTVSVEVAGTGSMYPSLYWDQSEGGPEDSDHTVIQEYRSAPSMYRRFPGLDLFGKKYFFRSVSFGDLVAFQNEATKNILVAEGKNPDVGFIKRVIGLPGDTIELRDGYVLKNGQIMDEPYLYLPRSTYGGQNLADCLPLTIPAGHYFVLGDNRKVSTDSRSVLGLIKDQDISFILPYSAQSIYHSLWRDTSQDERLLGTPTLDQQSFYQLINQERVKAHRPPLKPVNQLVNSASVRGLSLLTNPDTAISLQGAMEKAGYNNVVIGEFVSYGRFTAAELLQNILGYGESAKQIMHDDYQEIGVTAINREINGCPTQIIVGHLGGYVPASYSQETLANWQKLRDSLGQALTSWEGAVGYNQLDQTKLFELLAILRRRLNLAEEMVKTIEQKLWLSQEQETRIKADEADAARAADLAKNLNGD